ncbi:hypothetical protein G7Y79_00046g082470 [Physcia stellaris]|nr:hypothetical protein G7Y79_00046g082470 [Physcia stellaris]
MATSIVPTATQSLSIPGRESGVFARVRLVNEHGRNAMQHLGENYDKLSFHNRQYLRVNRVEKNGHLPVFDGYDSEYEPDPSDCSPGVTWEGVYELSLDGLFQAAQGPRFGITISKGLRTAGPSRGVDLLIIYPTKHPRGVLAIHAVIQLHPQTAWPMLVGVSNDHPVICLENGVRKTLGVNQKHALCGVNHFFIGQIECTFTLSGMALAQLELWGKARRTFLATQGLPSSDPRIPILPLQAPIRRVGSVKIYKDLKSGGFGVLSLGVDINTGNAVAVKSCLIKDAATQAEIINEVEVALKFTVLFKRHTYHVIMDTLLGQVNMKTLEKPLPIVIFWGVLQGLAAMHHSSYVHRDVTHDNMVVMPGLAGKLCDFGKAEKQSKDTLTGGAPLYAQAPELDGKTPYTYGSDVWSCAFAFLLVLFPNLHTWAHYQRDHPQTREWILEANSQLTTFELTSPLHRQVSELLRLMLSFDPNQRPSVKDLLTYWPVPDWARPRITDVGNIGQPEKKAKNG